MKFNKKQEITPKIEKFISYKWIQEWFQKSLFENIYKEAVKENINVGQFTQWLYDLGINPLLKLKEIPESFLEGNDNLIEITIPDTIKKINESAFYGCSKIRELVIPRNVEIIEGWSLAHMNALQEVTIQCRLEELNAFAIYDNDDLKVVSSIPENKEILTMMISELKNGKAKFQEI